jgi:hypothetical protein
MSNIDTSLAAAATSSLTSHPAITALVTSSGKYTNAAVSFKAQILRSVETLRKESYTDDVIRCAIREVLKDAEVSRQFVNRILTLEASKGGCGMAKERNHADKAKESKDSKGKESGDAPSKFDLTSPEMTFAALMVSFGGDISKIDSFAERLHELSYEAKLKAAAAVAVTK